VLLILDPNKERYSKPTLLDLINSPLLNNKPFEILRARTRRLWHRSKRVLSLAVVDSHSLQLLLKQVSRGVVQPLVEFHWREAGWDLQDINLLKNFFVEATQVEPVWKWRCPTISQMFRPYRREATHPA